MVAARRGLLAGQLVEALDEPWGTARQRSDGPSRKPGARLRLYDVWAKRYAKDPRQAACSGAVPRTTSAAFSPPRPTAPRPAAHGPPSPVQFVFLMKSAGHRSLTRKLHGPAAIRAIHASREGRRDRGEEGRAGRGFGRRFRTCSA